MVNLCPCLAHELKNHWQIARHTAVSPFTHCYSVVVMAQPTVWGYSFQSWGLANIAIMTLDAGVTGENVRMYITLCHLAASCQRAIFTLLHAMMRILAATLQ